MLNTESNKEKVWCLLQYLTVVLELLLNPIPVIHTGSAVSDDIPVFITRHSLVKAKGDVLVLLYGFLFVFLSMISRQPAGPIHTKFCMRAYSGSGCVFSLFGG